MKIKKIGILGGSFDPPHEGHLAISQDAHTRFCFDEIWWLVSPQNPLKSYPHNSFEERFHLCERLTSQHPYITISDKDKQIGKQFTVDTLEILIREYPTYRFYWIMGSDVLLSFHLWKEWKKIFFLLPLVIYVRPGYNDSFLKSTCAQYFKSYQCDPGCLGENLPSWSYIVQEFSSMSSTFIRKTNY